MTLSQYFRLMDVQARMLLKAEASRFALGFLWWFLEPLIWVSLFYVVFNLILDSGRRAGDFLLFLTCGKFAFIWFSKTVNQASVSLVVSQGLIGKIDLPKSLFPMAAVQESLYRQASVYLLLLLVLLIAGTSPSLTWLWLAPLVLVTYLMIVACSLLGAFAVCVVRDFQKLIPLGMTFLMFTSGIFWDVRNIGSQARTDLLLAINPLAFIIDAHRQVLMYATPPDALHLAAIGLGAAGGAALMIGLMQKHSQYLALRVLS